MLGRVLGRLPYGRWFWRLACARSRARDLCLKHARWQNGLWATAFWEWRGLRRFGRTFPRPADGHGMIGTSPRSCGPSETRTSDGDASKSSSKLRDAADAYGWDPC